MTPDEIGYPVIGFFQGTMLSFSERSELVHCSGRALNSGYFNGMRVVDSGGRSYAIESADPVKGTSWFVRLLGGPVEVRLDLSERGVMDLPMLKKQVISILESEPDFWSSGGELTEMKARVQTAGSHAEVIKQFL